MKNRKIQLNRVPAILTGVILLGLVISASSSPAAPAQTYHGTLTDGTFYCDGDQVAGPVLTGTWNLVIDTQTPAQLTLDVFYNGSHHLAWGYNALILDPSESGGGVYVFSGFGGIATATLDTRVPPATFSWQVELDVNCPDDYPYNLLTFFGVADRGRR
jgi:hypothetical protein